MTPTKPQQQQKPKPQAQGPDQKGKPQGNPRQADYDIFVSQGIKLASAAAQKMQGKASIDSLGNALAEIVTRVEDEGIKHGIKFDFDVMIHGAQEILTHMLGMAKVDANEEHVKAIAGFAVGKYIEGAVKAGKIKPEELQQLAQMDKGQQQGQPAPQGQEIPGGVSPSPRQQGLLGGAANG